MIKITPTHERLLVILIALHSVIVGAILFIAPQWGLRFGGWDGIDPEFFGRQAGIFHFVLATGYLIEYFRYRGVVLLISAKCIAVGFLTIMHFIDPNPWAVWVSSVGDGIMAALAWWIHRAARDAR